MRRTLPIRLGLLELTALHAFGEGSAAQTSVLDAALTRSTGRTSQFFEVGYGMGNTGSGEHGAFAWSARIDNGGSNGYSSLYARQTPESFETIDGSDTATRLIGATVSRRLGTGALLTADLEREMAGNTADLVSTVRQTYQFSQPLRFGSISLIGEHANSVELGSTTTSSSFGDLRVADPPRHDLHRDARSARSGRRRASTRPSRRSRSASAATSCAGRSLCSGRRRTA